VDANSSGMLQGLVTCVVMQMEMLFCMEVLNHFSESLIDVGVTLDCCHTFGCDFLLIWS